MSSRLGSPTKFALISAFALLSACAQQSPPPVAPPVAYNPPGPASAKGDVTWYHVTFPSGGARISPDGQQVINTVASSMQSNTVLTATLVGKTDSVGNDAQNMRLSQQRATAVRQALLQTGKIAPQRIETRWMGERHQRGDQAMSDGSDAANRSVDIGVH